MIDGKFDVIFRGQIVKGRELNEVKNNLVSLFKSSLSAVEPLFSGADIKIKKSLDYSTAMKYQSALKQAGALAIISEVIVVKAKANFMMPDDEAETNATTANSNDVSVEKQSSIKQSIPEKVNQTETPSSDNSSLTVAEVGSQLMPDKIYEKRDVDTSDLSLANVGERILPAKAKENHPTPSIDHLSLENL
ncbi:MAG: hypothetical protein COB38_07450 [Gammaproteobacteria bacterium]|nr:MAG: hypothetical protein COB38_07450 [Gammaproteobacteria bacterium]